MCFWKYFFRSPQSCLNSNDIFCLFLNNQVESSHKISQKMCWAFVKLQVLSACQPSSLWRPCGRLPPVFCICWIRSPGCLMTSTNVGWERGERDGDYEFPRWEMNGGCWWTRDERESLDATSERHDIDKARYVPLVCFVCFTSFTPDSPTKETMHNMENTHRLIWVSPEQWIPFHHSFTWLIVKPIMDHG